jgi:hypothetical protein
MVGTGAARAGAGSPGGAGGGGGGLGLTAGPPVRRAGRGLGLDWERLETSLPTRPPSSVAAEGTAGAVVAG